MTILNIITHLRKRGVYLTDLCPIHVLSVLIHLPFDRSFVPAGIFLVPLYCTRHLFHSRNNSSDQTCVLSHLC